MEEEKDKKRYGKGKEEIKGKKEGKDEEKKKWQGKA